MCIFPVLTDLSAAESPSRFWLLDAINESNHFSRTVQGCLHVDMKTSLFGIQTRWMENDKDRSVKVKDMFSMVASE